MPSCGDCDTPAPQTVRLCTDPLVPASCIASARIANASVGWLGRRVLQPNFVRLLECNGDEALCSSALRVHTNAFGARQLFLAQPVVTDGSLSYTVASSSLPGRQLPCHATASTTCVRVEMHLRLGERHHARTWMRIRLQRDPCGVESACRNSLFRFQFDCAFIPRHWADIFKSADADLSWGKGQTLAVAGAGVRAGLVTEFRPYRSTKPKKDAYDEPTKWNPAWDAPDADGAPKLLGSSSFFPPPGAAARESYVANESDAGAHDFQVAWLAVQQSGMGHPACSRGSIGGYKCDGDGDAHNALLEAMEAEGEAKACAQNSPLGTAWRPGGLAFNAHAYLLRVYGGSRPENRAVNRNQGGDYYVDTDLLFDRATGRGAGAKWRDNWGSVGVPSSVVASLRDAMQWLLDRPGRHNITVLAIGILTHQLFSADPEASAGISELAMKLQKQGLVILGNGGNCRMENCSGLPWPAVARGILPVGAAARPSSKVKVGSLDSADCAESVAFVCGARYSSGALPAFAAHAMVLREAFETYRFAWRGEGETMHGAILSVSRKTGTPIYPNWRANMCANRWCADTRAALDYVRAPNETARAALLQPITERRATMNRWLRAHGRLPPDGGGGV